MKTKEQIIHQFWKNISIYFTHRSINEFFTRHMLLYEVILQGVNMTGTFQANEWSCLPKRKMYLFTLQSPQIYTFLWILLVLWESNSKVKSYNGQQISYYFQLRTPYSPLGLGAWSKKAIHSPTAEAREAIVRPSLFHLDSRTDHLLPLWPGPLMVCSLR